MEKGTKKLLLILGVVGIVLVAIAIAIDNPVAADTDCGVLDYRRQSLPLMQVLSDVANNVELRDDSSRRVARAELEELLDDVGRLPCRNAYPLKHETLEYAIRHTLDALEAVDNGDMAEADQALGRALINVERFQDWSVDIN